MDISDSISITKYEQWCWGHFKQINHFKSVPDFGILIWLTPDDFDSLTENSLDTKQYVEKMGCDQSVRIQITNIRWPCNYRDVLFG